MPFRSLVGHRLVAQLLARAVANDTLPPSLLFAGPAGIGKFTTAIALAEALNCTQPLRGDAAGEFAIDACGECTSCRRLARAGAAFASGIGAESIALDCLRVLVPDEKQSIKIDPVRSVIERAGFRPFDGARRVVVIDRADALEVSAQNAWLKMLEEPPPGTVFVLVTDRPDGLLPTIRSRCPRLTFAPLERTDVESYLASHPVRVPEAAPAGRGRAKGPAALQPLGAEEAKAVAALARGSIGRALALVGEDAGGARSVAETVLRSVAGNPGPGGRLQAAQLLIEKEDGKKKAPTRAEVAERLEALAGLLRDLEVLATKADERWLANADRLSVLRSLAAAYDADRLVRAFESVDKAQTALERNVSQKSVADWLAMRL